MLGPMYSRSSRLLDPLGQDFSDLGHHGRTGQTPDHRSQPPASQQCAQNGQSSYGQPSGFRRTFAQERFAALGQVGCLGLGACRQRPRGMGHAPRLHLGRFAVSRVSVSIRCAIGFFLAGVARPPTLVDRFVVLDVVLCVLVLAMAALLEVCEPVWKRLPGPQWRAVLSVAASQEARAVVEPRRRLSCSMSSSSTLATAYTRKVPRCSDFSWTFIRARVDTE